MVEPCSAGILARVKQRVRFLKEQSEATLLADSLGSSLEGLQSFLEREHGYCGQLTCFALLPCPFHQGVPRVACSQLSRVDFFTSYEQPHLPVIITGLTAYWPAMQAWRLEQISLGPYRNTPLRCLEAKDGRGLRLKLKYVVPYLQMRHAQAKAALEGAEKEEKDLYDELYMFDPTLGYNLNMQLDYQVPEYFQEDLFAFGGHSARPPFRWVLIGPAGTGSMVHVDPLGTNAWNTLIQGVKRWVLLPPSASRSWARTGEEGQTVRPKGSHSALDYFAHVVPKLRARGDVIELDQFEGETIFVPAGWWHAVLNVTDTVAVTQNFVSSANLLGAWEVTCQKQPQFAVRWLEGLRAASSTFLPVFSERLTLAQIVNVLQSSPCQPNFPSATSTTPTSSASATVTSTASSAPASTCASALTSTSPPATDSAHEQISSCSNSSAGGKSDIDKSSESSNPETVRGVLKQVKRQIRLEVSSTGDKASIDKPARRLAALQAWVTTPEGLRALADRSLLSDTCGVLSTPEVKLLLEAKASAEGEQGNEEGVLQSPLLAAVRAGKADVVKLLWEFGAPLATRDACGRDASFLAAEEGELATLEFLLGTKQIDVNGRDDEGRTPLIAAAERGRLEVLRPLLLNGANMDLVDEDGRTAERAAMEVGQTNFGKALRTPAAFLHVTGTGGCWSCVCGCCSDLLALP